MMTQHLSSADLSFHGRVGIPQLSLPRLNWTYDVGIRKFDYLPGR